MPSVNSCPHCGARLSAELVDGLCPACVFAFGLRGLREGLASPAEPAAPDALLGEQLRRFGDYELLETIGRGGMGVVFKARQHGLNRLVAVKLMQAGHFATEAEVRRFRAEAEAAGRLQHPNIVAIHEVGEQDGQPFFSMDLVEGPSLAELIREAPLPARRAARYVRLIAEAVQCAHDQGILHRDLKPSNVLVDAQDHPRLTDFGLAKLMEGAAERTLSGTVFGSPGYASPEQAAGKASQITARSDVYSLGAILYETLVGRPPFEAETPAETMRQVLDNEPVPPRLLNSHVPRDVETICLKCLEKLPARRYASAREVAEELERFLRNEPIRARPVGALERGWRWCGRNRALAGALAAALLLLITVAVGATVAAVRVSRAERDAREKLWASYLVQARASRLSDVAGRRATALAAVAAAAKMKSALELRNEAIACLALTDLGEPIFWRGSPPGTLPILTRFDADLDRYAVGDGAGRVTIYDARDHRVLTQFSGPPVRVADVVFSPDGQRVAANFSGSVRAWDGDNQSWLAWTNFPTTDRNLPHTVAFHTDGQRLAVADPAGSVRIIDMNTGLEQSPALATGGPILRIDWAPASELLAVVIERDVQVWNVGRRERVISLTHAVAVSCIAWHPDARHLAAGCVNGELGLWDTQNGGRIPLPAYTSQISSIGFIQAGDLLATHSWDAISRFWDATTGRHLFKSDELLARQFSRDGQRLFCSRDGPDFGVVRVERSDGFRTLRSGHINDTHLYGLSVTADGRWVGVGAGGNTWHLWDARSGREIAWQQWDRPTGVRLEPNGQTIFVAQKDRVLRCALTPSPDGTRVDIGAPETILASPGTNFEEVSLSADGHSLLAVGGRVSTLVDLRNNSRRLEFGGSSAAVSGAISPDNRWLVTATFRGAGVSVWDGQTGRLAHRLITNDNALVAFSPDGRQLVTHSTKETCFWDTTTWQVQRRVPLTVAGALGKPVAFSGNGRLLALVNARQQIQLLDPQTGNELATLTAPEAEPIRALALSGDGQVLAAATINRLVQLWDLRVLRRELAALKLDW